MQISHRYKFIFFSFPKTGSESVRQLLAPFSDVPIVNYWEKTEDRPFYSHISPAEVKALFKEKHWEYDDYYRFTFVRNPWARMVSLYNMIHHTKPAAGIGGKIKALLSKHKKPSFKQWLITTEPGGRGAGGPANQRWRVYGSYSIENYIKDEAGRILVDKVIKLEDINEELPPLLQTLALPDAENMIIPRINTRKRKNYADYYDDESRQIIAQRYKYDIEHFDYHFSDIIQS